MSLIKKAVLWPCLAAMLLATAVLVTPASAQDANIRSVTFDTVKPDRIGVVGQFQFPQARFSIRACGMIVP